MAGARFFSPDALPGTQPTVSKHWRTHTYLKHPKFYPQ